jgi:hypothetical protein
MGSGLENGHSAGPTGRSTFDFDREARYGETKSGQDFQVVQFLNVAITYFAA